MVILTETKMSTTISQCCLFCLELLSQLSSFGLYMSKYQMFDFWLLSAYWCQVSDLAEVLQQIVISSTLDGIDLRSWWPFNSLFQGMMDATFYRQFLWLCLAQYTCLGMATLCLSRHWSKQLTKEFLFAASMGRRLSGGKKSKMQWRTSPQNLAASTCCMQGAENLRWSTVESDKLVSKFDANTWHTRQVAGQTLLPIKWKLDSILFMMRC